MTHEEKKLEVITKVLYEWEGHRFKNEIAQAILTALRELERSKVVSTGDYIIDDNGYAKIEE